MHVGPRQSQVHRLIGLSRVGKFDMRKVGLWTLIIVVGALVIVPISLLLLNSFREVSITNIGFGLDKLTLNNYIKAYTNPRTYTMLANSLWFAVGSMLVALIFGGGLAFISERTDMRFRELIPLMVMVPLIMPSLIKALAWTFLLSPQIGLLNKITEAIGFGSVFNAYSVPAMIWVDGISMSTLAFLLISSTLTRMDPFLEEAALGSGASMWKTQLRVTMPLLRPALAGVVLLLFIRGLEAFEVPLALGLSAGIFVFSTNIYFSLLEMFPPRYGLGFAYGMTLMVLTVTALIFYQRQLAHSERYAVVSGKAYRPRVIPLGRGRYLAGAFTGFYGLVAVVLPVFVLVWGSVLPYYQTPSVAVLSKLTLQEYRNILTSPGFYESIKNTAILGLVSSSIIMFVATLSSWLIYRTNLANRRLLDFILFMPYAVSSVVIALGFLILFLSFPNPLYGTIWIIVLAYVIRYLPYGTRFMNAAVLQINKELEEAAWASGAGFWKTFRHVWMPLIMPALVNGGLFVLILSVKVMSIPAFLQGPDNQVLAVYLWNHWTESGLRSAATISVLMLIGLGSLTLIVRRLGLRMSQMYKGME